MSTMRNAMTAAAGLALAATSVLVSSPTATAADAENVHLKNQNSQLCLAVPSGTETQGTVMIQWTCSTNNDQLWFAEEIDGGVSRWRMKNNDSGLCLAVGGSSEKAGADVIQWPCSTNTDQVWVQDGNRLRNLNSNLCLAVPNSSKEKGEGLIQWTCSTNTDQSWIQI